MLLEWFTLNCRKLIAFAFARGQRKLEILKIKCELNYLLGISFESWLALFTVVPCGVICTEALSCHHVTKALFWIAVTIALTKFTTLSSSCVTKSSRNAKFTVRTPSIICHKKQMH